LLPGVLPALLLRRISRRSRRPTLRRVAWVLLGRVSSRVDGRQRRGRSSGGVLLVWGAEVALLRKRIRGRTAQRVVGIHGERCAARVGSLRAEARGPLLARGGGVAVRRLSAGGALSLRTEGVLEPSVHGIHRREGERESEDAGGVVVKSGRAAADSAPSDKAESSPTAEAQSRRDCRLG
jgi:hypothetical protein